MSDWPPACLAELESARSSTQRAREEASTARNASTVAWGVATGAVVAGAVTLWLWRRRRRTSSAEVHGIGKLSPEPSVDVLASVVIEEEPTEDTARGELPLRGNGEISDLEGDSLAPANPAPPDVPHKEHSSSRRRGWLVAGVAAVGVALLALAGVGLAEYSGLRVGGGRSAAETTPSTSLTPSSERASPTTEAAPRDLFTVCGQVGELFKAIAAENYTQPELAQQVGETLDGFSDGPDVHALRVALVSMAAALDPSGSMTEPRAQEVVDQSVDAIYRECDPFWVVE